ncbi:MAG: hypothetical protein ABSF54_09145, partial [Bryobacteraceae bacterium]
MQNRSHPIWKRLLILGFLCEKLEKKGGPGGDRNTLNVIHKYIDSLDNGILREQLAKPAALPAVQ